MDDWVLYAVDALVGAAAAALVWLLTRRLTTAQKQRPIVIVVMVFAMIASREAVSPWVKRWRDDREMYKAALAQYGNEDTARMFADSMQAALRHPRMNDRLKGPNGEPRQATELSSQERQAIFRQLTNAGLSRLSPKELAASFKVKIALAQASPVVCAGLWTGALPPELLMEALRRIPEEQQKTAIGSAMRSALLELDEAPPQPRIPAAIAEAASEAMIAAIPSERKAAYVKATSEVEVTEAEACAAFLAMTEGIEALPEATRETAVRLITIPGVVEQ